MTATAETVPISSSDWLPRASKPLRQQSLGTFEDAGHLRSAWDRLALGYNGDIYSTFDWCQTWWRHYGDRRHLGLHLWHSPEVVAAAPTFHEDLRLGPLSLRVVRIVGCDHSVTTCGLPWGLPEPKMLLDLLATAGPDLIQLGPLAGYYHVDASQLDCPAEYKLVVQDHAPQMVFDLPPSFDEYLSSLAKKKRAELRREERELLNRRDARVLITDDADEMSEAFGEFIDLHQAYWREEGRLGHFDDWPGCRDFHRDMVRQQARHNRVLFVRLQLDGRTVASEYCYRFGPRLHWFLTARRREISGRAGITAMIRAAIDQGITQIDAMRGYYDYKKWLGARMVPQKTILLIHERTAAKLRTKLFMTAAHLLDVLYYRLWFSRIAPRLASRPRPLQERWIRSRF